MYVKNVGVAEFKLVNVILKFTMADPIWRMKFGNSSNFDQNIYLRAFRVAEFKFNSRLEIRNDGYNMRVKQF